ncbi:MAG: hypothetical protein LBH82_02715 [Bacteroidales bacterium]|jgi:hypothetical protein|nr:hypothetical protein [Bacteroidales bacterium]
METYYNKETIQHLINRYFDGDTSFEEEEILREYFLRKEIDEDLAKYRSLFEAWTHLAVHPKWQEIDLLMLENKNVISGSDKKQDKFPWEIFNRKKLKTQKYIRLSTTAVAGIAACVLLFFITYHSHSQHSFVIIDGVKYTDKKTVQNAFDAALENVYIDFEDVFSDFHDVVAEE